MYQSPNKAIWKGRNDPGQTEADHLWHHVMQLLDLNKPPTSIQEGVPVLLGFASDEGVRRNQGRTGAVDGPEALRKALCNLAVHFDEGKNTIYDAGNVITSQGRLEEAQQELASKVNRILSLGAFPILMGGGHEIAYGHYCGVRDYLGGDSKIGILNLDAHFDLRGYENGAHSGSPFRQIYDDCIESGATFHYLPVGINPMNNTKKFYQVASQAGVSPIPMDMVNSREIFEVKNQVLDFIKLVDKVYVTLDLDVISGAYAPGVSAPAPVGVFPQLLKELMRVTLQSGKVVSFDIAELNPTVDDGRTARLAASFIYQVVMGIFKR